MKVTILDKRRVFDGPFKIDEVKLQYERSNRNMTPVLMRLNFEPGDSVAAVIVNTDTKKVILANQFRYPTYEKGPGWITEIVTGMVVTDDSPEAAVRREIMKPPQR